MSFRFSRPPRIFTLQPKPSMMPEKPYAPAAERNKQAILEALQKELSANDVVLEFGSGTGQHLCHFAAHMPGVLWQPSDLADKLTGIRQWIAESGCTNILTPLELDLGATQNPETNVSVCYSANTLHIVSWTLVEHLFRLSATLLGNEGKLCIYGPYSFDGEHVSDGNRQFDQQLRCADPSSGIRDKTDLDQLAQRFGFTPARVISMPANNHLLIWDRPGRDYS